MIAPQFMLNGWITTTDWLKKTRMLHGASRSDA